MYLNGRYSGFNVGPRKVLWGRSMDLGYMDPEGKRNLSRDLMDFASRFRPRPRPGPPVRPRPVSDIKSLKCLKPSFSANPQAPVDDINPALPIIRNKEYRGGFRTKGGP